RRRDRQRPARRAVVGDRDDLSAAARHVPPDAEQPRAGQRGACAAEGAPDRVTRRLSAPEEDARTPARRLRAQDRRPPRSQVTVTSLIAAWSEPSASRVIQIS